MTFHRGKVSRSKRLPLQEPTAGCVVKVKAHGAQLLLGQNYALFRLQKIKLSLQIESAQRRRIQVAKQILVAMKYRLSKSAKSTTHAF